MKHSKYEKYKDSGISWLGEIPEHWEIRSVRNSFLFETGFTPSTEKDYYYDYNGFTWITISDLKGKFVSKSKSSISQKYLDENPKSLTLKGSLLYSFKLSVGKVAFAAKDLYTNEAIFSILPDINYDLNYYYYSLPNQIIKNASENIYGAKMLNQKLIKAAKIVFPPKKEQTTIANFLDYKTEKINRFITKKKQLIKLLKEQKEAIINEMVTGKKVWDGNSWTTPVDVKDSGIEWLGDIPVDWEVRKLSGVCDFVRGNSSFKRDELLNIGNYVALQYGKTYKVDEVDESFEFYVNDEFYKVSQVVNYGDVIIISTSETIEDLGHSAYYNRKDLGLLGGEQILLRPNIEIIDGKYLFYSSKVFTKELQKYATGVKVFRFNINDLKTIYTSIPSVQEQKKIVKYIESELHRIDKTITTIEKEIALVEEYKTALIAEAVTGKIDVRDFIIPEGVEKETYEDLEEEINRAAESEIEYHKNDKTQAEYEGYRRYLDGIN